jgi:NTP pyrophosphatase (non-canonical NTP hydrolase)
LQEDPGTQEALRDECADVLLYLLLIADRAGINLEEAARHKLEKNAAKYPIEKSYGSSRKYTQFEA